MSKETKIAQWIAAHRDEYLQLVKDVCRIETPSGNAENITKAVHLLGEHGKKHGLSVRYADQFEKAGEYAVITLERDSGREPLVLMAHMDTVHKVGSFGPEPVTEDGPWLHGPGVVDCKGGAVMALYVLEALAACNACDRTVKLLLTADEEVSSLYSGLDAFLAFLQQETKGAKAAFNCETGRQKAVVVGRKGITRVRIRTRGVSAHAGSCATEGASAIRAMAHIVLNLEKYNGQSDITFNCGIISGGTKSNVVADYCEMECDIRYFSEESRKRAAEILEEVLGTVFVENTTAECEPVSVRYAMPRTDAALALAEQYREVAKQETGVDFEFLDAPGGADSAYTTYLGVPTVCAVGPYGTGIHSSEEKMHIPSLSERAGILAAVLCEI